MNTTYYIMRTDRKHQQELEQQDTHDETALPALPLHCPWELSLTEQSIKKLVKNSQFFPPDVEGNDWFHSRRRIPNDVDDTSFEQNQNDRIKSTTHVTTLSEHDVHIGKILGRGGFCEVRLAYLLGDKNCSDEHTHTPYAIKYLSPSIIKRKGKKAFSRGAADLAIEARFLSLLSHVNIIKLHYVSQGSFKENYNCLDHGSILNNRECEIELRHLGYFLVLDHLHETLDHRIKHTYIPEVEHIIGESPNKHHYYHNPNSVCSHNCMHHSVGCPDRHWTFPQWMYHQSPLVNKDSSNIQAMQDLLIKRLVILRSAASAIRYLHYNNIIFRDIKPDNIGFYYTNNGEEIPKLFDFGLATELKKSSRVMAFSCHHGNQGETALYKLTGRTGSRRYMSPEVAFSEPYNEKCDIYSLGVLLYEMSTLIQPFEHYTIHAHESEVLRKGCRPCLQGYSYFWPKKLSTLIDSCWKGHIRDRPGIDQFIQQLDDCIDELTMQPPKNGLHDDIILRTSKGKNMLKTFLFPRTSIPSTSSMRKKTAPQA